MSDTPPDSTRDLLLTMLCWMLFLWTCAFVVVSLWDLWDHSPQWAVIHAFEAFIAGFALLYVYSLWCEFDRLNEQARRAGGTTPVKP